MSATLSDADQVTAWSAHPDQLDAWLAGSEPAFTYARGERPAPATKSAVTALFAKGLVTPTLRKLRPEFHLYIVQRTAKAKPRPKKPVLSARAPTEGEYAPIPLASGDEIGRDLLALLKRLANTEAVCPENAVIARQLGLPNAAAARYQFTRLENARQIEITRASPKEPRVILIRATGQTTGSPE